MGNRASSTKETETGTTTETTVDTDDDTEDNPDSYEEVTGINFEVNGREYFIKKNKKYVSIGKYTGEIIKNNYGMSGNTNTPPSDLHYKFVNNDKEHFWNSSIYDRIPEKIYQLKTSAPTVGGKRKNKKSKRKSRQHKKRRNTKTHNRK